MSIAFGRLSIIALSLSTPLAAGCGSGEHSTSTASGTVARGASTAVPASSVSYKTATTLTPPESVGRTSSSVEASYADAEIAFRAGRYNDAEELFTKYTVGHPDNAWGYYMLGLSSWKTGNLAHAIEAFERGLALDPRHRKSLLNSARVLLESDRAAEALERINRALALEPTSAEAIRLLGRAYHELGRTDEAIGAYHRALTLDHHDVWAMNNLGLLYIQLGRYNDALPPLARATQLRSTSPVFQNNLAVALERTGHYAASRSAYQAALRADSTYDNAKSGLVRVADRSDDSTIEPADVPTLAQGFAAQVQQWQDQDSDSASSAGVMARDTTDTLR